MNGRPDSLHVVLDPSPGLHAVDSDEVLWWLPILGPSATLLAGTLVRGPYMSWLTEPLATRLGLRESKLWDALERLDRFRVLRFESACVVRVRTRLPQLTDRQLDRLPGDMAATYRHLFSPALAGVHPTTT